MKILIDAFPLLAPKSGVGYYTWFLLNALEEIYKSEHAFSYFYGRRFSKEIVARPPTVDALARKTLKRFLKNPYVITQPIKELVFKLGCKKIRPDIYHSTNYVLLPFNGPQVVTVFDMSIARFPETHPAVRVNYFNKYFYKRLPAADKIISISEFTKREMIELMGIDEARIIVTPLAPPLNFCIPEGTVLKNFQKKVPDDFFLYLGNLEPRKNLLMLLEAYKKFADESNHSIPKLVLAGEASWLSQPIFDKVQALNLDKEVIFPGYVAESDLANWYASARAFLYPSKYEGFGLPVIEAMAMGTPVIASNAASIPEVTGDVATLIHPDDTQQWAQAMAMIVKPDFDTKTMVAGGILRAAKFSWINCAKQTFDVYKTVLNL